jgi:hypothetical protein
MYTPIFTKSYETFLWRLYINKNNSTPIFITFGEVLDIIIIIL